MFHQGFQTPRNRWNHKAAGRVLLLFRVVWNPWWNRKHKFLIWLLKWNNTNLFSVTYLACSFKNAVIGYFLLFELWLALWEVEIWCFLKKLSKSPAPGKKIIVKSISNKWFTSLLPFEIERSNAQCRIKIPTLGIYVTVKFLWITWPPSPRYWHW